MDKAGTVSQLSATVTHTSNTQLECSFLRAFTLTSPSHYFFSCIPYKFKYPIIYLSYPVSYPYHPYCVKPSVSKKLAKRI